MSVAAEPGVRAVARWRLLSLGFTPPSEEIVSELETLAESLWERDRSGVYDELLAALRDTSSDELAAQYDALFGGTVRISPYEGGHELDPVRQGRVMADVAAFYRAFGAEAGGPAAERPDHVGCELEYLAFLELRRLATLEDGVSDTAPLGAVETSFLRDHAARWLPTFFAEVREAAAEHPVYRALAAVGSYVLRSELEQRGLEYVPVRTAGEAPAAEAETFDCG